MPNDERSYLVYRPESLNEQGPDSDGSYRICIVKATSQSEALDRYVDHFVETDKYWQEHVYTNSVNMSFAEALWKDENGNSLFDSRTGGLTIDYDDAERYFRQNVERVFGDRPDYAELYLRFFEQNEESDAVEARGKWQFPHYMMKILFYAEADRYGEYFTKLVVTDLADLKELP